MPTHLTCAIPEPWVIYPGGSTCPEGVSLGSLGTDALTTDCLHPAVSEKPDICYPLLHRGFITEKAVPKTSNSKNRDNFWGVRVVLIGATAPSSQKHLTVTHRKGKGVLDGVEREQKTFNSFLKNEKQPKRG